MQLCAAAAVFAGYLGFCGVQMARYSSRPLEQVNAVMILGCQVHGNTPGNELVSRMESALPLIEQNPSAPVIVTGGQGRGEFIPEADAMKAWLVEKGVSESRIYTETQSHSTRTNFEYSAPILRELGVTDGIAVVTNDFHQYRADIYAAREGLSAGLLLGDPGAGVPELHYKGTRGTVLCMELTTLNFDKLYWSPLKTSFE